MGSKYIARHSVLRCLGEFEGAEGATWSRGQQVILRSDRGLEVGELLCDSSPRALSLIAEPTRGQIVRLFNADDQATLDRLREAERHEFEVGCRHIELRKLEMELIDVEHLFG